MKLRITTCLSLILITIGSQAQNIKKLRPVIEESCKCIEKVDLDAENMDSEVEGCLQTTMMGNIVTLMDAYGIQTSELNEETGYNMGIEYGKTLLTECPAFMSYSIKIAEKDGDLSYETLLEDEVEQTQVLKGQIVSVSGDEILRIKIKDQNEKTESFVILENFPNSEEFTDPKTDFRGRTFSFR